jgi:hypothetical protein
VNDKLEMMWKEAVVAKFQLRPLHFIGGGADENHETPRAQQPVSGPRYEPQSPEYEARVLS